MAALASKNLYPAPHNFPTYRSQSVTTNTSFVTNFASPTDSEFSVGYDEPESVRTWDETKVAEWLRNINAGQYVDNFRENNITGENLMDLDQAMLKEIGIKKVGDRVRIGAQAKLFRHQEYRRKRTTNRDSFARFDQPVQTPPSSGSPRPSPSARSTPLARVDRRPDIPTVQYATARTMSRPGTPPVAENQRPPRVAALSPPRSLQREPGPYPGQNGSSAGASNSQLNLRSGTFSKTTSPTSESVQYARSAQVRLGTLSTDPVTPSTPLDRQLIRVIYDHGRVTSFGVELCKNAEEIISKTLKKGKLNETHVKSYCFYLLEGTEPVPAKCRRLTDVELIRVCTDSARTEKERLMFRKIHGGEPEGEQLLAAAALATEAIQQSQNSPPPSANSNSARSQIKIQKLTGESLPPLSYPMSPASVAQRERHFNEAAQSLEPSEEALSLAPHARPRRESEFPRGDRPPSELVVADTETYFPDHKDQIETIRRMSVRRSQRLSRAHNRLSVASTVSVTSPPVPVIPPTWLNSNGVMARARPLSVFSRTGVNSTYRDSLASYTLGALDEESPHEPNRKSYVSFGGESGPDSAMVSITDPDGNVIQKSDYDETSSNPSITDGGSSINEQLSQAIAEDGEDEDDELNAFLQPDSWEDIRYIRGKLIGQGSFGSVYLALHAITAELMAVKQVELPSTAGTAIDAKKNNMVAALKHEIALLRELKHPHIVQYLGSSSDANNLNIFLEYIPGGSIAKMLVDYGSLSENLVANFVRQILVGLAYLHSKDIIHRDIKGANVLVDNHGSVKISDFGISKRVQDSKSFMLSSTSGPGVTTNPRTGGRAVAANRVSLQGSVFWMAPEVVRQTAYTRKADIWSLGCLVVEMLTGTHPHPTLSQLQAIFKIGGRGVAGQVNDPSPEIPAEAGREAREFLRSTFKVEWQERPEAEELSRMAFVERGVVGAGG